MGKPVLGEDVLGSNWQLPLGFNSRNYNISVMVSRLPKDRTLEMEDWWKIYKKYSPPVPHLLQAQQALALLYAEVAGRPGTGSYPTPSPSPTTQSVNLILFEKERKIKAGKQIFEPLF